MVLVSSTFMDEVCIIQFSSIVVTEVHPSIHPIVGCFGHI